MSFFMLDVDALDVTVNTLQTLYGEVERNHEEHCSRVRQTHESLSTLRGHNFSGLDTWHIEQIWNDLPFGTLSWEFRAAEDAVRAAAQFARHIVDTLEAEQQGLLEGPLRDLCSPALGLFEPIASPLGDLGGWLSFSNLWSILSNPESILDLLDAAERAFREELDQIDHIRATLQRLKQRALLFIEELQKPIETIAGEIATVAGDAITVGKFLRDLAKEGSIIRVLKEAPHLGPLDVLVALLGYAADSDHSLHSLAAHLAGAGVEFAVDATVVGGLIDLADSGVSLVSHVASWGFDAAGYLQGGRWGARLEQVGYDWERTAGDADAMGDMFTDTGAAIIDLPDNVKMAPPGLSGAVLAYDEVTGQGTQALNHDVGKFMQDTWHLAHVVPDAERSVVNSVVVTAGDYAQLHLGFLPQGVRQSVDNGIYDVTSWLMIGG